MNNSYDNFFVRAKQTVYKWWCVVYKPVYKLTHNGYWPNEKEPGYKPPVEDKKQKDLAAKLASQIMADKQDSVNDLVLQSSATSETESSKEEAQPIKEPEIDLSTVDSDALARAQEIMDRLNKEAAEDEAKKQAEINQAKKQAEEQEKLAAIMKANQVDISAFIEEGKEKQKEQNLNIS